MEGSSRYHAFNEDTYVCRLRWALLTCVRPTTPCASLSPRFLAIRPTRSSLQSPFIMRIYNVLRSDFFLIVCFKVLIVKATTCYWPNGSEISSKHDMQACNSTANGGDSGCCGSKDVCTTKGYCFSSTVGFMYRGGCTNPVWNPEVCFPECLVERIAPRSLV